MPVKNAAGCLGMLIFLLLELAALAVTIYLAHLLLAPLLRDLMPASENDFANVVAIVLGLLIACVPVFLLDRLCKRLTGASILDNIPHLP